MKKLFLALLFLPLSVLGQCDVELLGFDTTTGDITIVVNNSENCGCNEFTNVGTSCSGNTEDNEVVHHLNLGINFDNTLPMPECAEAVEYHPGWRFLNFTFVLDPELPNEGAITGDTLNFNIIPDNVGPFDNWACWQEYLNTDLGPEECIEFVIWQINYSQTNTENQGAPSLGGYPWQDTCGTCDFQTQNYPDVDNSDNFFYWCGDELPPPPIYVYPGCTDLEALNYDPNATEDDGSCEYPIVEGCDNPTACNYDEDVTEVGGLCVFCYSPYELGDSICNAISPGYWDWYLSIFPNCVGGCTDPEASNYNENATGDDGSCEYTQNGCDVDIIDVDPINGIVTVEVVSSEGCSGGDVDMLMIGFHALDENCVPIDEAVTLGSCVMNPNSAHVGWWYGSAAQNTFSGNNYAEDWMPASSGDTLYLELYNPYNLDCNSGTLYDGGLDCCADDFINYWFDEGYSVEFVIWQINHGHTWYAADGGWATTGANGDGTQPGTGTPYVDQEDENRWVIGPCGEPLPEVIIDTIYVELPPDTIIITDTLYVELPPDTITFTEIDTIYIELPPDTITIVEIDTIFVELPPDTIYEVDTLIITVTEVDTIYIQLPPDTITEITFLTDTITITETEFIFITDTILETEYITLIDTTYVLYTDTVYVYEFIEVDCETGLPCSEIRSEECNVYIPNAFTPDNDGYNDAWEIVLDPECWTDVKAKVVSRWGNIVWESNDPNNLIWDGSYEGGDYYVQEEMYMWLFQARKVGTTEIKDLKGHVVVVR